MSQLRVISQVQSLFVGPTPSTGSQSGIQQIYRVQSANYNEGIQRQDVNQFGNLGAIDRVILEPPTVNLDFSYIITNVLNEKNLGFVVDGSASCISGILNGVSDDKNYFLESVAYGNDANDNPSLVASANVVEGFGNSFISSYGIDLAVGAFPTARLQVESLNYQVAIGSSGGANPAVNPVNGLQVTGNAITLPASVSGLAGQASALRPGDITINFTTGAIGVSVADLKPQRFSMSLRMSREKLRKFGSTFDYAKVIQFPFNAECTIESLVGDYAAGSLASVLCNDISFDISATLRLPNCSGAGAIAAIYTIKNCKLDSQNSSQALGSNKTISMTFSSPVAGPSDLNHGLLISGILV